jgi:hypothetical protein
MLYTVILMIFVQNYFDKLYMRITIVSVMLSIVLDFIWLIVHSEVAFCFIWRIGGIHMLKHNIQRFRLVSWGSLTFWLFARCWPKFWFSYWFSGILTTLKTLKSRLQFSTYLSNWMERAKITRSLRQSREVKAINPQSQQWKKIITSHDGWLCVACLLLFVRLFILKKYF